MKLTEKKVIELLESVFSQRKGSISLQIPLESFMKDSMDVMEFIAILKNKYQVNILPAEIISLRTVQSVVEYILANQKGES